MKLNCIIDTCSCILLSFTSFQQKSLLKHFHQKVNLNYSKEVSIEINDHLVDKGISPIIKGRKLGTVKHTMDGYEMKMLGKILPSRKKKGDKGETDNFLLSIDLIHHIHKGPIIYLTDDQKAVNGFLNDWIPAFPAIKLWSSFEVILFLYAEKVIPSKDVALELVKEIISFSAPKPAERSEEKTQKLLSLVKFYNQKIERVSQIIN